MDYFKFWGKARPSSEAGPACHLLAYHSLDVAAVGALWLENNALIRTRAIQLLGLEENVARTTILRLLALHDLGKFAGSFQALSMEAASAIGATLPANPVRGQRHDAWSLAIWEDLRKKAPVPAAIHALYRAFAGHHGVPPVAPRGAAAPAYSPDDVAAASAFADDVLAAMGLERSPYPAPTTHERVWTAATFFFAGFAVACDWIGSNQAWFPYCATPMPLEDYWRQYALPRARRAIADARVGAVEFVRSPSLVELLPHGAVSTPLQQAVASLPIGQGPQLHIVEDLTGAGKTEAAIMLALRLIAAGHGDGMFFALPTQATANAMWRRLRALRPKLTAPDADPTIVLAHGARALVQHLSSPILAYGTKPPRPPPGEATAVDDAALWLADDMRKAMLADIGIGTVDQAALSVFPEKFQSLRLMGLARRILVLDEIHAYDAYMGENIATLLRFHAALGGSAVLLSATLTAAQRRDYAQAYRDGLDPNLEPLEVESAAPFPLLTAVDATAAVSTPVAAATRTERQIGVVPLDPSQALARVVELARGGACVCWLRNTVADVLDAAASLAQAAPDLPQTVFHARFAMADRLRIETEILRGFGPGSSSASRRGRVVVASQVIEQSLDVDFDEMVSDIAPIDLLIQRAGRVHRHTRPERSGELRLHVVMPPWDADPSSDWLRASMRGTSAVYRNHAIVWRTARILMLENRFDLPEAAREIIEAVYGDEAHTPPDLQKSADEALGAAHADQSTSNQATLEVRGGYAPGPIWLQNAESQTRLGDPQTTLRLARIDGDRLRPWADDPDPWRAWKLSEVRVRAAALGSVELPQEWQSAAVAIRAEWPDRDAKHVFLCLLQESNGEYVARLLRDGNRPAIGYSPDIGLRL